MVQPPNPAEEIDARETAAASATRTATTAASAAAASLTAVPANGGIRPSSHASLARGRRRLQRRGRNPERRRHQHSRLLLPALIAAGALSGAAVGGAAVGGAVLAAPGGVTTINGKVPPGTISQAKVTLLLRQPLGDGAVLYQYRTERAAGTRAPIHTHPSGGSTCVIRGQTTMRIEGVPGARTHRAGECFYMPTGPAMANFNSGSIPFMTIDTFLLRPGQKPMKVLEPGKVHIEKEFHL